MYLAQRLAENRPAQKRSDLQNLTNRKARDNPFWMKVILRSLLGFAKIVAILEVCPHDAS